MSNPLGNRTGATPDVPRVAIHRASDDAAAVDTAGAASGTLQVQQKNRDCKSFKYSNL
jgi:hypothetical protein